MDIIDFLLALLFVILFIGTIRVLFFRAPKDFGDFILSWLLIDIWVDLFEGIDL